MEAGVEQFGVCLDEQGLPGQVVVVVHCVAFLLMGPDLDVDGLP